MNPAQLILFTGILYVLGFSVLTLLRRQRVPIQFAIEGLIITGIAAVIAATVMPVDPFLFLIIIYLVTMRVRLLVDLGNWFTSRQKFDRSLALFSLALRLKPDETSNRIVLINRGVTLLRMQRPEEAYTTLKEALSDITLRPGAKYLAAGFYNLGLACRRTGREDEAIQHFNEAINKLPNSIYAYGARQALKKGN
jgi:tetratricopeptide (TPR) repeat protein